MDEDAIAKSRGYKNAGHEIEMKRRENERQRKAYFREEGKKLGIHPKHIKEHQNPYWDKK